MAQNKDLIVASAPTTLYLAGVDVGFTKGPVTAELNVSKFDIEVDQVLGSVNQTLLSKITSITFPLAQHDVTVLKYALMVASGNVLGTTGLILKANDDPASVTAGFRVADLGGISYDWFFHAVKLESINGIGFGKGEQSIFACKFRTFPASGTTDTIGYWYKV